MIFAISKTVTPNNAKSDFGYFSNGAFIICEGWFLTTSKNGVSEFCQEWFLDNSQIEPSEYITVILATSKIVSRNNVKTDFGYFTNNAFKIYEGWF